MGLHARSTCSYGLAGCGANTSVFNETVLLDALSHGLKKKHASWIHKRLKKEWQTRKSMQYAIQPSCVAPHVSALGNGPPGTRETYSPNGPSVVKLHSSDTPIAVVLFDDRRTNPKLNAMTLIFDTIRRLSDGDPRLLSFHAVLAQHVELAGVQVSTLDSLPSYVHCIHQGLKRFVHQNSPLSGVLFKALLHWILPADVVRAVVLDSDVVPLRSLTNLRAEFDAMRRKGALFGVTTEQSRFYSCCGNMPPGAEGYNTGVWLQDLEAMRSSVRYAWYLDAYQAGLLFRNLGTVPEQNFANGLAGLEPEFFHRIGCGWNRQIGSWMISRSPRHFVSLHHPDILRCDDPCAILHFNVADKCLMQTLAAEGSSCSKWNSMIDEVASPLVPEHSAERLRHPTSHKVNPRAKCTLWWTFGGTDTNATMRAIAANMVRQYWGGCCRTMP